MAVAAALISAHLDIALPPHAVLFGEISLSGTVRRVTQADARLKEAGKLGFEAAVIPAPQKGEKTAKKGDAQLTTYEVADLQNLAEIIRDGL